MNMRSIIFIAALTVLLFVKLIVSESDGVIKNSTDEDDPNKNKTVLEKWEFMENTIKQAAKEAVKQILPFLLENSAKMNLSKECMRNSMHLISGLKNLRPWAVRFLDSSAKGIDGVFIATLSSFGSFQECLDTEVKSTRLQNKELLYRGQYCTVNVRPPLPPKKKHYKMDEIVEEIRNFSDRDTAIGEAAKLAHFMYFLPFRLGICTPSGCSKEDISKIVSLVVKPLSLNTSVSRCEIKEEIQFSPGAIGVIICYSLAGFLMFGGTLFDIYAYYTKTIFKNKLIRLLMAFSFVTNFRKFTNTETRSATLSCLNGIRFLSMTWVIVVHTYLIIDLRLFHGLIKARTLPGEFAFQIITNSSFAVDTFFFMGGLLVCYLTIKLVRDKGHKLNVFFYIFHRLWRLIPAYVFVMISMFLISMFGSGPVWHDNTDNYIQACYDNWWTNLLFINNFCDSQTMCVPHTWYLASDFQLYVASLLILLPLIRWQKIGISLSILAIFSSILYTAIVTYVNDYPPTMLISTADPDFRETLKHWASFYFRPFIHASPYCIGLLTGYLLATKPDLKIPPFLQVVGWSLAFTMNFSVLYGIAEWNKGVKPSLWTTLLYASFNRTVWALGIAWMIICCATGHGGVINYILSWKIFVPLGRLTYLAYLVHPLVQLSMTGSLKTTLTAEHFVVVWLFFGHLCVTYGVAFAGSMLIEAPCMALEKMFLNRKDKKLESNSLVIENNILNGSSKSVMNGDIGIIIPVTKEECGGVDNKSFEYTSKL